MPIKHLFIQFCLVISVFSLNAQTQEGLLEKAHQIAQHIASEDNQLYLSPEENATADYIPVLKEVLAGASATTLADLLDSLNNNPFLGRGGESAKIWILADPQTSLGMFTAREGAAHASASSLSVTTVADGIAKFLVSRVKEELSIAFFKQFKEDLERDKGLTTIFPATTATLILIDSNIYQFSRYLASLQASFEKDMKTLPDNFRNYISNSDLVKSPKYRILLEDALLLSQDVIDGIAPDSIIEYFGTQSVLQQPDRIAEVPETDRNQLIDLAAGLRTLNLLSQSLYTFESGKQGWLTPAKVSQYLGEPNTRAVYLALLWQRSGNIKFSDGKSVQQYLTQLATADQKVMQLVTLLKNFSNNCNNAEQAIADYKSNDKVATYEPYYRFIQAVLSLLETGGQFKATIAGMTGQSTDDQFIKGIKHLNELNFDVRQKNYAAAINDLMYVIQYLLPDMNSELRNKIFKYGQFIASVASAENSDQVAAAIDAVALPPGSSRVKKENYFSAAVNAYTGGAAGWEYLSGVGQSTFLALSAPVGLTCSWKFRDLSPTKKGKKRTPGSFSVFAPIIDVGALVAYRFNDPVSNDLPELQWSNLLSPGLYGVFGFRNNLPLSLGIGAQRGPNLRKIEVGGDTQTASAWRYGLFMSVDIPVFNLYIQSKKGN